MDNAWYIPLSLFLVVATVSMHSDSFARSSGFAEYYITKNTPRLVFE